MTGLEIYKLLPKTNCKKCGYPTCLAFAMALASGGGKTAIDRCPEITDEARRKFLESTLPPIKTIALPAPLTGEVIKFGGETVLYRHEKTFYNPCGLGIYLSDGFSPSAIDRILTSAANLRFERAGRMERVELLFIENKNPSDYNFFEKIVSKTFEIGLIPVICSPSSSVIERLASRFVAGGKNKFLVVLPKCAVSPSEEYVSLCAKYSLAVVAECAELDECARYAERIKSDAGFDDIMFLIRPQSPSAALEILVQTRHLAIKKNVRALGYPVMVFTTFAASLAYNEAKEEMDFSDGGNYIFEEGAEASQYIEKYASAIILSSAEPALHLALVTLRQNIYTDPQKPVAVEPKLYKIGAATPSSPLLVTTNFSLTYYSVVQEIESSKVPAYLLVADTEGMSVLTAWAADKFTPEIIRDALLKNNVASVVSHRRIIIPGYVSVVAGKLSALTGFEVVVGPKEASGLSRFLKDFKA